MLKAIKAAKKDYEDGKCPPTNPCQSVTSLAEVCKCTYDAAKAGDTDQMASCICQTSADPNCERNAKKIINQVFP
jgi:hypothetical protein